MLPYIQKTSFEQAKLKKKYSKAGAGPKSKKVAALIISPSILNPVEALDTLNIRSKREHREKHFGTMLTPTGTLTSQMTPHQRVKPSKLPSLPQIGQGKSRRENSELLMSINSRKMKIRHLLEMQEYYHKANKDSHEQFKE